MNRILNIFVITLVISMGLIRSVSAQEVPNTVITIGAENKAFDWSEEKCEDEDVPDSPADAFIDKDGNVQLIATHARNYRMIGPTLASARKNCTPIFTSVQDPDPSHFTGYQWINSVYTLDGETIFAVIHNEFQSHREPGVCHHDTYEECWYNSLNLAISRNGGETYTERPGNKHLIAAPYKFDPDLGEPHGYFAPGSIVQKDGFFYFVFKSRPTVRNQEIGTCLMRGSKSGDSIDWKMWDGNGFNITPQDPYIVGGDVTPCEPISPDEIGQLSGQLTYNDYFGKYIQVGIGRVRVNGVLKQGFIYSLSDDLIHWSPVQLLMEAWALQAGRGDGLKETYPAILDDTKNSRNFEVTGRKPYLYFTRNNPQPADFWDRDLIRLQVTFTIPPKIPSGLSANAVSDRAIHITWNSVSKDESAFEIQQSKNGAGFQTLETIPGDHTTYTASSLDQNTNYEYRVRGRNAAGVSEYTATVSATTGVGQDSGPPTAPTDHRSAAVSESEINLTWGSATDDIGIEKYLVDVSRDPSFENFVTGWQAREVEGLAIAVRGLSAGTKYYSRVRAKDTAGNIGPYSNVANATTHEGVGPDDTTRPTAELTAPESNETITGTITIRAEASDNVGVEGVLFTVDGNPIGREDTTSPYSIAWDSRTVGNGPHEIRAVARDAADNKGSSAIIRVTVDNRIILEAPTGLRAEPSSSRSITLDWEDTNTTEDGFKIERSTDGISFREVGTAGRNATEYIDTLDILPETTYFYRIKAYNREGYSAYTRPVTVTTPRTGRTESPPPQPTPPGLPPVITPGTPPSPGTLPGSSPEKPALLSTRVIVTAAFIGLGLIIGALLYLFL